MSFNFTMFGRRWTSTTIPKVGGGGASAGAAAVGVAGGGWWAGANVRQLSGLRLLVLAHVPLCPSGSIWHLRLLQLPVCCLLGAR